MKLEQPAWPHRLPTKLVVGLATLGPVGRRLPAPGTWGSVAGLLYFTLFFERLGVAENLVASAAGFYFAAIFCGEAETRLRKKDPGEVILDEFVAMPLCFLGWHSLERPLPAWTVLLAGFALFRFYDIVKPLGIRSLQKFPGGWGVAIDDTAAALATCTTLHLGTWLWAMR
jgi:phosphatidylglycerophosphatase A